MSSVVSIGSNVGDRLAHLRIAVAALEPAHVSSVWRTEPVGGVPQSAFLNAVLLCPGDAGATWAAAQQAEAQAGRTREVRWGPRRLDVDLIVASGAVPDGLVLPHPRAHERAFVLAPWLEVQPDAQLPQGSVAALLDLLGAEGVTCTGLALR